MPLLYTDPLFLDHDTGAHPEKAERLRCITAHLKATGLVEKCQLPKWLPISLERLARVHAPKYAAEVKAFAANGGGRIEADTRVSPKSYDAALLAAGAVCDAVEQVVAGKAKTALALVRPPGHHALKGAAMGFCLFNNVALGAMLAVTELKLDRVLVVDWDVHHGNGTQDAFWDDGRVAFLSLHRWPFYPGTGSDQETGAGRGQGLIVNLPTEFGVERKVILDRFRGAVEKLAAKVRPQLVLMSAGFDAHRSDPIGSLGLETDDYRALTNIVLDVAAATADGKTVCVLEGGYNVDVLPHCVAAHLEELIGREGMK